MELVLILVCVIEFIVILLLMLDRLKKNKFNLEDYEYILISICRSIVRDLNYEDINIDDLAEEVEIQLINTLSEEGITIPNSISNIMIIEYIKNVIITNNLVPEAIQYTDKEEIDEIINNISNNNKSISILDVINNFYT